MLVENPNANANAREREPKVEETRTINRLPRGKTALAFALSDERIEWLTWHVCHRWDSMYGALSAWREKLSVFEKVADENYEDRRHAADQEKQQSRRTILEKSNHSLGVVAGFADFAYAQARDDLFGSKPWFAATPHGRSDDELAKAVTRHAHWKLGKTNLTEELEDSLRIAVDLGTAFPKFIWRRDVEEYEVIKTVAVDEAGNPVLGEDNDFIVAGEFDGEVPGEVKAWEERLISEEVVRFDNVLASNIHFRDIAFDATAPELDLIHTDVCHQFEIGLLDAANVYGMTPEQYEEALALQRGESSGAGTALGHRGEEKPDVTATDHEENANPTIRLVEGYFRVNPYGDPRRNPVRIWCVFSPENQVIFAMDYLANRTPGGRLPVSAVRCFKKPNRIIGVGYHERFESVNTFIDEEFNAVNYRDRCAANPHQGVDLSQFEEDYDEEDFVSDPDKRFVLKSEGDINQAFQFAKVPDANQRAVDLLNMSVQMIQLRTGITSAAQGEIDGAPEVSTATGVNAVMSRGATLLKWPIDQMKNDLTGCLSTAIHLLYANHDRDETFTWSEGDHSDLMTLKAGDVRGLEMDVKFTLTQSQSQDKLASSQTAIEAMTTYFSIPEPEKQAARPLFIQLLTSIGIHNADEIVRPALDPAEIPPEAGPESQPRPEES